MNSINIIVLIILNECMNSIVPEPTARSAVPGVSPGRGLLIDLFNNNDAILNFEHIAVHCGLSRVI